MMKKFYLITILILTGLISYGQNQKTYADSLFHHDNGDKIYRLSEVDSIPKYLTGENDLYKFIGNNIEYPRDAKENGIQGVVFTSFVIEKDGSISDMIILRSVSESCDNEAFRILNLLPNNWTPAFKNGQAVRSQYILPFKFTLVGVRNKKNKRK